MRKISLLISLLFCLTAIAQNDTLDFEIKKTGIFTDDYKKSDIVTVGANAKGGVTMVRSYHSYFGRKHGYVFENFSDKMAKLKTHKHEMSKKEDLLDVFIDNQTVNMIGFIYDKKQKAYICYAESANTTDFKFTRKELFRINIKREKTPFFNGGYGNIRDDEHAQIIYNRDKSAFAIKVDLHTGDKKKELHAIYVFNNKLDFLVKGKLEMNFVSNIYTAKIGQYHIEDIEIAKDGKAVYVFGRTRIKKKKKDTGSEYKFEFTKISTAGTETKSLNSDIEFDNNVGNNIGIIERGNEIICMGFNKDMKEDKLVGIHYISFDPVTFEIKNHYPIAFPEELKKVYGEKNYDKEMNCFDFKGLVIADDYVVFNAEQLDFKVSRYYDGKNFTEQVQEQYKDILSMKINDKGEVLWTKVLDKFQYTNGAARDYLSFKPFVVNDQIYYFINGNFSTTEGGTPYISYSGLGNSDLNVMKIDTDGNQKVVKLLDVSKIKVPFRAQEGVGVQELKSMFFLGREYKNKQLIRINL